MNSSVNLDYDGFNKGKKIYVKNWYQHYIALKQKRSTNQAIFEYLWFSTVLL